MKKLTIVLLILVVALASAAGYLGYRVVAERATAEELTVQEESTRGQVAIFNGLLPILAFSPNSVSVDIPGNVTDDLGREVYIGATSQKIVSLAPSITEILFALDAGDQVVGVTNQCDYPEEVAQKVAAGEITRVGDYWGPGVETIVALAPDLVLTEGYEPDVVSQLEGAGLKVVIVRPGDIAGILKSITFVGKIIGKETEADQLVSEMKDRIISVATKVLAAAKPGIFYEGYCTLEGVVWTTGSGTFQDSLITLAGGRNVASAQNDFYEIGSESLTALNGDIEVIIWGDMGGVSPEDVEGQLPWSELTAMRTGKVYVIDPDLVNRAGPRIVDGLEQFAQIIHPELF